MAFHSEAINHLCFACGNIIMKNAHIIDPSLLSNFCEAFASNTAVIENISPRSLCHVCCRAVKHFMKKKEGICYRIPKSIIAWLPHADNGCETCDLYTMNKKE